MKVEGWLTRDDGRERDDILFWPQKPTLGMNGGWFGGGNIAKYHPFGGVLRWTPQWFGRKFRLNFEFPKLGSIHRVEIHL